jgi:hypothetical protein
VRDFSERLGCVPFRDAPLSLFEPTATIRREAGG